MRWTFFCCLQLLSSLGSAQYYETYSPANGLVDARINRVMQDGNGRMFFLTRDGISIFDGQTFFNHTNVGNRNIGIVNDGYLQPDGSITLACFNGYWVKCRSNRNDPDTNLAKGLGEVSKIIPVSFTERIVVSNLGMFHMTDGQPTTRLKLHDPRSDGKMSVVEKTALAGNTIVFNYFQKNDSIIYACDKNAGIISDSLTSFPVMEIVTGPAQTIYLCTTKGILQLDTEALQQGRLVTTKPWFDAWLPRDMLVMNLFFDRQQNIWLIGNSACVCIDPVTGKSSVYATSNGLIHGIQLMYQDSENNYWFIAPGMGVQKLLQTNYEIISKIFDTPVGLVTALNTTPDGGIFIGHGKQLWLTNHQLIDVPVHLQRTGEIILYWQKTWWTYKDGTSLISDNKTITIGGINQLGGKQFYPSLAMGTDRRNNLVLSGNHVSVIQPDHQASIIPLPYFADNVAVDEANDYWVFCRSNDVVKLKWTAGKLQKSSAFSSPGIEPRFAMHWRKDTFWIATRYRGIVTAIVTGQSIRVIGQLDRGKGLSNDFVETLLRIDDNRVAIGTASGLDIVTIQGTDTTVENISSRINHFEPVLQLTRDLKGHVYARTENNQLFRYDPAASTVSGFRPAAWFNSILVNGNAADHTESIFNFRQNNFSFAISAPSFADNRNILFHFTLSNDNNSWKQQSNKPVFEINNLTPGNYQLVAIVKYPGRIYPDQQLMYAFTIRQPYWKTWWFISLLVALILFSAWYLSRSYFNRQLQKQRALMEKELAIEQERNRLARELHDGLGSMLSGIKHSFAAMKNRLALAEKEELIFHSNIDKLNESIIELRNLSHSMASESLLKYGLENSLKDYCHNLSHQGHPTISFNAIGTSQMKLTDEQSFHIFRIVQELLQNCIKHAGASQVILQLSFNQPRLYITVEDDGKGFELNQDTSKGMGLKNIETRVKILKGKMDYRTAPETGTSVLIEIPCQQKD